MTFFNRFESLLRLSLPLAMAAWVGMWVGLVPVSGHAQESQNEQERESVSGSQLPENLGIVVIRAFKKTHNGFSSDEVILNLELNENFIRSCRSELPDFSPFEFNWTLLNLRKAGKLNVKTTKRDTRKFEAEFPIAEICCRMLEDRHGKSIDRLLADPATRKEFDDAAKTINQDVDGYLVRKAAFRLRKTRRLQPELITRIADWGRKVEQYAAAELQNDFELIPATAGIYIFRDATGYLYVGEAKDLRSRLKQHFDHSENRSLSRYLKEQGHEGLAIEVHTFEKGSRIEELKVRRAYESELIRSRKPKFNVRP